MKAKRKRIALKDVLKRELKDSEFSFYYQREKAISEIVKRIDSFTPQGGANLERALATVRYLPKLPDSIVLFTDGLPTKSDSIPYEGEVGPEQRIRFFEVAKNQIPPHIPISTIMFPFTGDPAGPAIFWELANYTRGAFVSPSKSWPDL